MSLFSGASFLLIPSGYKSGKVYSLLPDNGDGDLTWTRGSTATRTNSSGQLEEMSYNLLLRTEEFNSSPWILENTTVTSNSEISPNGTLTADRIFENTVNFSHNIAQNVQLNVGTTYTFSCYVKKGTRSYCTLEFYYNTINGAIAFFNLDNGTLVYQYAVGTGYSVTNSAIQNVGNGWYRLSGNFTVGIADSYPGLSLASTQWTTGVSYSNGYVGSPSDYMILWGAQLVVGTEPKTYLPVSDTRNNFPRLDYSQGSCPSVLLEQQRTNLSLWSQSFANTSWIALNSTKVSTTQTDPSGTNTAANITWTSGGSKYLYRNVSGLTIGTTYTITFYVKSSNASKFRIYAESLGFTSSNFTATSEFQRYSLTYVATVTSGTFGLQSASDNTAADLIVAFAQFESGAFATTYIPTLGLPQGVTRSSDACVKTGISSLIGQTQGVVYFKVNFNSLTNAGIRTFFSLEGDISNQFSGINATTGNNNNNIQFSGNSYTLTQGVHKVACLYDSINNTSKLFVDGSLRGTNTFSAFSTTITRLAIGCRINPFSSFNTDRQQNGSFFEFAIFPTLLSDSECETLTTL